ncbi:hypothetical protein Scep_005434 [Stephania cephalantha]|uniref:Uncharacterized protein n=1 Tax=Stephania cephalantha TaxID=152367 RepID=A0AAP0PXH3_9MAGN
MRPLVASLSSRLPAARTPRHRPASLTRFSSSAAALLASSTAAFLAFFAAAVLPLASRAACSPLCGHLLSLAHLDSIAVSSSATPLHTPLAHDTPPSASFTPVCAAVTFDIGVAYRERVDKASLILLGFGWDTLC